MKNLLIEEAHQGAQYIKQQFNLKQMPTIAIILGSGLGDFINQVKVIASINYEDIPHFPKSYVVGHKGRLSLAEVGSNRQVLILEGRLHYYEGFSAKQVAYPITILGVLGVKQLILSNASGGINPQFKVGDLMLIEDHINFSGDCPLIGKNDNDYGSRFLDLTQPYDKELIDLAKSTASSLNINPQQGTYIGVMGPTYETRAEIRAFRTLGADAVGMSTIYEVIVANYFKIKVLAIAAITNMATGISTEVHDHSKIVSNSLEITQKFSSWVLKISSLID